ncbi:hypothetical protein J6590_031648 [Homalodisca vitripennis]|nr:hypothetical protein J6590_031648 [Homalodisca vitripennis]
MKSSIRSGKISTQKHGSDFRIRLRKLYMNHERTFQDITRTLGFYRGLVVKFEPYGKNDINNPLTRHSFTVNICKKYPEQNDYNQYQNDTPPLQEYPSPARDTVCNMV